MRTVEHITIDKRGVQRKIKSRIRSINNNRGWYLSIPLLNDKGKKTVKIHRIVYETFIGEIKDGYEVHHIDGNRQNNCIENLRMVSTSEHHRLTREEYPSICNHMIYKNKFGRKEIGQFTKEGVLVNTFANSKIAQMVTGICSRNICQVVNKTPYRDGRVRQTAGGYIWRYVE